MWDMLREGNSHPPSTLTEDGLAYGVSYEEGCGPLDVSSGVAPSLSEGTTEPLRSTVEYYPGHSPVNRFVMFPRGPGLSSGIDCSSFPCPCSQDVNVQLLKTVVVLTRTST